MANLVQKFVVHPASDASPLLPQHVALVGEDGAAPLGELAELGSDDLTVVSVKEAHNALVAALVAAGLASAPSGE